MIFAVAFLVAFGLSALLSLSVPGFTGISWAADEGHEVVNPWNADTAMQALRAGNGRFVAGKSLHPNSDKTVLDTLASHGQFPLAAVLSCSDSRAPVEEIFDLGFGDIFSIRVAGEVPGVDQVGSIEYAVAHLKTPLIVVLGHTKCGAVTAAVNGLNEPGSLGELLSRLSPIAQAVSNLPETDRLAAAINLAATRFKEELPSLSPVIDEAVKAGRVKIVAAVYDLDTRQVTFL
jgi:carbonic anhydrase